MSESPFFRPFPKRVGVDGPGWEAKPEVRGSGPTVRRAAAAPSGATLVGSIEPPAALLNRNEDSPRGGWRRATGLVGSGIAPSKAVQRDLHTRNLPPGYRACTPLGERSYPPRRSRLLATLVCLLLALLFGVLLLTGGDTHMSEDGMPAPQETR